MLKFSDTFFQQENRCGFEISKMMKRTWAAQLELLCKVIDICNRHQITYYALFGTLLGAVRHKGYIPWDDDLDIGMKKEDYDRFIQYAKVELPKGHLVITNYTHEEWNNVCARITNASDISIAPADLAQRHGCPFIVGIDVFPIDYVPADPELKNAQGQLLDICKKAFKACKRIGEETETIPQNELTKMVDDITGALAVLENYCDLSGAESEISKLLLAWSQLSSIGTAEDSDYVMSSQIQLVHSPIWKKAWFDQAIPMNFENIEIMVPQGYDEILRAAYGDYMYPKKAAAGHNYPFYKEQLQALLDRNMWDKSDVFLDMNRERALKLIKQDLQRASCSKEVKEKLHQAKQNGKKVLLYAPSEMGFYRYESDFSTQIETSIEQLKQQEQVVIWFLAVHPKQSSYLEARPDVMEAYLAVQAKYEKDCSVIWDESEDITYAADQCDAMYGDMSYIAEQMVANHKPVMVQQY